MNSPRPKRQPVHGLLIADKPVGPSSTQLLGRIKFLFQAQKAGHGGTLDPMASGLLPILFGEATKFSQEGLEADKAYRATIRLGETTATGDAEGEVLVRRAVDLTPEQVLAAVAAQAGPQLQIPPMYSALKRDGKPLYEYARAGVSLERPPRPITVYAVALVSIALPEVVVDYRVSKGTYVRVLAESLGEALGTGAHLRGLRRTEVGPLRLAEAISLEAVEAMSPEARLAVLKPVDYLIQDWPSLSLTDQQAKLFSHGQAPLLTPDQIQVTIAGGAQSAQASDLSQAAPSARIRVMGPHQRFLGVAYLHHNHLKPARLMADPGSH